MQQALLVHALAHARLIEQVRREALEEAANVSAEHAMENGPTHDFQMGGHKIAEKIRSLIETPPVNKEK
jgi:hypothetical protein